VDDELSILRMNTSILYKNKMSLNCCSNQSELLHILEKTKSENVKKSNGTNTYLVIFLDHILDNSNGIEVLIAAKKTQLRLELDIS